MLIEPVIRALADPTRLRVMRLLARMELAVGELAQLLGQSQPRISRHIKILCDAGLAARRREGSWVFIHTLLPAGSGTSQGLPTAIGQMLTEAEREDAVFSRQCGADLRRLTAIRSARETAAADYFAAHAEEWDQLRSLYSTDADVEAELANALGAGPLGTLLDIGTGTGRIADFLAAQAEHVTGLDKSPDMLRLARARLQRLPASQFELVQGDFAALPFADGTFDTVIMHQVLHYAQAPEIVLMEAARVTRPGGRIAIVDLATHDREELRQIHAHARLGFADRQVRQWLGDAGFSVCDCRTLPTGELTVTIWTATRQGDCDAGIAPDDNATPKKSSARK